MIQPLLTPLMRVAVIQRYTAILTFPLKGGRHLNIYCTRVEGYGCSDLGPQGERTLPLPAGFSVRCEGGAWIWDEYLPLMDNIARDQGSTMSRKS